MLIEYLYNQYMFAGSTYFCQVSGTFSDLWNNASKKKQIQALAEEFLLDLKIEEAKVGNTVLFITSYRPRLIRMRFLKWCLSNGKDIS